MFTFPQASRKALIPATLLFLGPSLNAATSHVHLSEIHAINQAEVKIGSLAVQRSKSADIKNFGDMLVRDHKSADAKLAAMATSEGFSLETSEGRAKSAEMNKVYDKLKKAGLADFDHQFAASMADGHKGAVELIQRTLKEETDARIVAYLNEILPAVQNHLKTAQALQSGTSH